MCHRDRARDILWRRHRDNLANNPKHDPNHRNEHHSDTADLPVDLRDHILHHVVVDDLGACRSRTGAVHSEHA